MPIFRVKSVKIYTGQKNLHWRRQRQLSGMRLQRKVPFTKDGPIQMIQIICKNKVLSLAKPSSLQDPIQADPDHLQKQNVVQHRPICKNLKKKKLNFITESRTDLFITSWPICKNQTLYWTILFFAKIWLNKVSSWSHGPSLVQLAGPYLYSESFQTVVNSNHPLCKPMLSN